MKKIMGKFVVVGTVGMRYCSPPLGLVPSAAFPVKADLQNLASSLIHLYLLSGFYFSSQAAELEFSCVSIKSDDSYVLLHLVTRALHTRILVSQSKASTDIHSESFVQSAVNGFCFQQLIKTALVIQTELEEESTV